MRVIRSFVNTRRYGRASKLNNLGRYEEALEVLSEFSGPPISMAKKVLFTADINHRKLDLAIAISSYKKVLEEELHNIVPEQDRMYLEAYAKYYSEQAKKKLNPNFVCSVEKRELSRLHKGTTLLIKAEFPL